MITGRKLDKIDRLILQSLRKDARQSITNIAKDAKISRPTAMKRLEQLINSGTIGIEAGMNLKEMDFRIGCVGLEVEGAESRSRVQQFLRACPRVLLIFEPLQKVTFTVYVFGENLETLRSVIYGFAEWPDTKIASVTYLDPPIYPKTFPVRVPLKKVEQTPCGMKCNDCFSYNQSLCLGCPAVIGYKGFL